MRNFTIQKMNIYITPFGISGNQIFAIVNKLSTEMKLQ